MYYLTKMSSGPLRHRRRQVLPPPPDARTLLLFMDGPLIELFLPQDGVSATAALPGDGRPLAVALTDPTAGPSATPYAAPWAALTTEG